MSGELEEYPRFIFGKTSIGDQKVILVDADGKPILAISKGDWLSALPNPSNLDVALSTISPKSSAQDAHEEVSVSAGGTITVSIRPASDKVWLVKGITVKTNCDDVNAKTELFLHNAYKVDIPDYPLITDKTGASHTLIYTVEWAIFHYLYLDLKFTNPAAAAKKWLYGVHAYQIN